MKAKKALKRLNKIEALLSNVIEQCPASARGAKGACVSREQSHSRGTINNRVGVDLLQ